MDWFAIVSNGVYPTPTPTAAEMAALIVSQGLIDTLTIATATAKNWTGWMMGLLG